MGLFSSLRAGLSPRNANDDVARSVLTMPLLVAASDGKIDDVELNQVINMCSYSPIFHAVGAQRTMDLAKAILADLRATGFKATFQAARGQLTPKLAETALCFAVRTSLADGYLAEEEKQILIHMGEGLGVAPETFVKIFDVLSMLQRPAA